MAVSNYLVVLFVLFTVGLAKGIQYRDCGSVKGQIKNVMVGGCSVQPCMLKKGTNATFEVDFMSKEVASKLTAVVHGIIADIPVPFPIDQTDACQKSGLACPLKNASSYSYKSSILVKQTYPKLKLPVKWELKDQDGNDIFCMLVLVQITD